MEKYTYIGKTRKTYGVRGEVKLQVEDKYLEDLTMLEVVFLKIKGKEVPYFIEQVKIGSNMLIKFEDIDSPEAALEVVSKEMFARKADLIPDRDRTGFEEELEFARYTGFTIIDEAEGRVGVIEAIVEYPQQEMAVINKEGREILIPMNENLIAGIDSENRLIQMSLPEGLLDL